MTDWADKVAAALVADGKNDARWIAVALRRARIEAFEEARGPGPVMVKEAKS